mmetsp:Transcript_15752/g.63453  ORF Transcript_15752/g.63453 Transcript_15752/m.63453 type:complete len:200 (+) Transcript_15752:61-660(+)
MSTASSQPQAAAPPAPGMPAAAPSAPAGTGGVPALPLPLSSLGGDDGAPKPRIKWDEPTIALHDLDRGTRQKIVEPETPFARRRQIRLFDDDDDDDDLRDLAAPAVDVVQRPGDFLVVPSSCPHAVENRGDRPTVAIAANFVDDANLDATIADLRQLSDHGAWASEERDPGGAAALATHLEAVRRRRRDDAPSLFFENG